MNETSVNIISIKLIITGRVQGVGFRPFIYRLAKQYILTGYVFNRTDGVEIKVEGKPDNIDKFIYDLRNEAPVASVIKDIEKKEVPFENLKDFIILDSKTLIEETCEISPDISTCNDCLDDLNKQKNRISYLLINCINCGPRFTIIRDFPYDRLKTTMNEFLMCNDCEREYTNILDRRFHAQPVACNNCGPEYTMIAGNNIIKGTDNILSMLAFFIDDGKIIAFKGIGGFNLACDAFNEMSVHKLRKAKHREGKPFAVMFSNVSAIKEYAHVNRWEEESLLSWKRPIVLLTLKKNITEGISDGLNTLGAFLPYMPIHHLLFEKLKTNAIVLTSGNLCDEPILIDNDKAIKTFKNIADAIVVYNRDIYNRCDDSVVRIINKEEKVFRRSRGYVPSPFYLNENVDGILATGAELVNSFCIGKEKQAILSQHIGDLKNFETYEFFEETIERFKKIFRFQPGLIACDLHPEYLSTKYAKAQNLEIIPVQHHHAHIASCMAEHGLNEKVIGISFDGTGFGSNGRIWGSEFLIVDLKEFTRHSHFEYIPLPGGDSAVKEPWKIAISYLYKIFGDNIHFIDLPFLKEIPAYDLNLLLEMIDKNINCPVSCGAGRLFDAVAALLGVCTHSKYRAEAPMHLESMVMENVNSKYDTYTRKTVIAFNELFQQIIKDLNSKVDKKIIATKFHNSIIFSIFKIVMKIKSETDLNKVVLSGGTFQNKYIMERLLPLLDKNKFEVFTQSKVPSNDGGIALGQLVVAANKRK